jgi:hypothetical protein
MIKTKLNKSQDYLIAELDENSPSNVFVISRNQKYNEIILDNSLYCIVYYSGWYGNHIKIITDLFNGTIAKFPSVKFGFKVFTSENELANDLDILYKGGIGKAIFILIKNKKIEKYLESNLTNIEIEEELAKYL